MLAKVWKKILLAVCIIACIYNVMYKLVNRTSLDVQLKALMQQTEFNNLVNDDKKSSKENTEKTVSTEKEDTIVVVY